MAAYEKALAAGNGGGMQGPQRRALCEWLVPMATTGHLRAMRNPRLEAAWKFRKCGPVCDCNGLQNTFLDGAFPVLAYLCFYFLRRTLLEQLLVDTGILG
jgi:hypothetical protein